MYSAGLVVLWKFWKILTDGNWRKSQTKPCKTQSLGNYNSRLKAKISHHCLLELVSLTGLGVKTNAKTAFET